MRRTEGAPSAPAEHAAGYRVPGLVVAVDQFEIVVVVISGVQPKLLAQSEM